MHCTQCGQALADDEQFCPRCGAAREESGMTFEQAGQEYLRLRGQLNTHHITPEQFDSALKTLMVRDAQGRYWMPGADSGQWYVHDGQQWVRANPNAQNIASSSVPPPARKSNNTLVLAIVALILFGLAAAGAFWFLQMGQTNAPAPNANVALGNATPTTPLVAAPLPTLAPIVPTTMPSATNARPTIAPAPTNPPPSVAPPTSEPPTPAPIETISLPATLMPATVVIIEIATATFLPPTELPSPTTTLVPPPETPSPTFTRALPTRTLAPTETPAPTEQPTPAYPPGVYVTQIKTEPAEPKSNQGVTFNVTFLNTTGVTQQYNWLIQIYYAESNKGIGETLVQPLTVPPGESVQTSPNNWQVSRAGGCIPLYAQAQFQNADTGRIPFMSTNGDAFVHGFNVCP